MQLVQPATRVTAPTHAHVRHCIERGRQQAAEQLDFAPVKLGDFAESGALVQGRGQSWAPLVFQDLVKFG